MTTSRFRTTLLGTMGVLTLSALAVLSPLSPAAHAHDDISSTTPADGTHLTVSPAEVTMVFTDNLIEVGSIVLVVDEAETSWTDGALVLNGDTIVQPVKADLPDGNYQVRWRVVSSDGHPIAGTFDFSTGATAPAEGYVSAVAAAEAAAEAAEAATADDAATDDHAHADEASADDGHAHADDAHADDATAASSTTGLPLYVTALIGAGLGLVVLAAVLLLVRRSKRAAAATPTDV